MKAKRSIINIISATLLQIITAILGFIIPKITLTNYGSEINGFMSLVTQIYSYIALLEAGLGTTVLQALYSPIARNDYNEISGIVNAAKKYYSKLALYYSGADAVVTVILPIVLNTNLSKTEVVLYFLIFGISNIVNFLFTAAYRPILTAEGKNYVNSNISIVFHTVLQFAKILLLAIGVNIIFLQLVYSLINITQVIVYIIYFKRNYAWIDKKKPPLFSKLKQRSSFFIQQLSNLLLSCTDIMILSLFCDLKVVSVYTVYMLVYGVIGTLSSNISSSTQFILAQSYTENKAAYLKIHRAYEMLFICINCILVTTADVLTIPFIKLYTAGVTDVNYIDFAFPVLLSINAILSTFKSTSLAIINFSYHAKSTIFQTVSEAVLNVILTLIFVPLWGMKGALLGTSISLFYRLISLLFYVNNRILSDSIKQPLKLYISNFCIFIIIAYIGYKINIQIDSYASFVINGIISVLAISIPFVLLNALLNLQYTKFIISFIKGKLLRKKSNIFFN